MINPHPPLSSIPIVLLVSASIFDALSLWMPTRAGELRRVASWLLVLLLAIAPLTFYSGYFGAEAANQSFKISPDQIGAHQLWAKCFLMSLVPAGIARYLLMSQQSKKLWSVWVFFLTLSLSLGLITAYQGGELVFESGAGVSLENAK